MKRAIVIKTTGDKAMGGAIVDGIMRNMVDAKEVAAIEAENKSLKAVHGVKKYVEDKAWDEVREELAATYHVKTHGAVYHKVILIWALTWLTFCECVRRLQRWNREM